MAWQASQLISKFPTPDILSIGERVQASLENLPPNASSAKNGGVAAGFSPLVPSIEAG
jgi:hypothetical protein